MWAMSWMREQKETQGKAAEDLLGRRYRSLQGIHLAGIRWE
jgi:hypothetical protein